MNTIIITMSAEVTISQAEINEIENWLSDLGYIGVSVKQSQEEEGIK